MRVVSGTVPPPAENHGQTRLITALSQTTPDQITAPARGDSDDQVIGMIRGHMTSDHPALLETVSREDLVSWIQAG